MKNFSCLPLIFVVLGCAHNEFDVSSDQVAKKLSSHAAGSTQGMPDLKHLPPGAVKHEYTFKKGDRLPDGSIADGDRKMVTVDIPKASGGAQGERRMVTVEGH